MIAGDSQTPTILLAPTSDRPLMACVIYSFVGGKGPNTVGRSLNTEVTAAPPAIKSVEVSFATGATEAPVNPDKYGPERKFVFSGSEIAA